MEETNSKKIIFFIHLNNDIMEKELQFIYKDPNTKKDEYPTLLCKMKNKFYKTVYAMYLLNLNLTNINENTTTLSLILQLKNNLNYPFEINVDKECFKQEKYIYYFHFDKIIFKERIKNNFFDNFLSKKKDTDPPFSCDINIFEQMQLIFGYINNQKRKEQFEILYSLKIELGFSKFSRITDLFLIYLRLIFDENYNIQLIQDLLDNYININFDIKVSFNYSLFFDSIIKPIFLKTYSNRDYIIYNNFDYDLRNSLSEKYNKILDKLCFKYYILYDIDFLMNEKNISSRISNVKQKNKFYEIFFEVLFELDIIDYNKYFIKNNLLSKTFVDNLVDLKNKKFKEIKENVNNYIDISKFGGLKINKLDNFSSPIYFLGKLNNGYSVMSVDDRELYIYDSALGVKIRVESQLSKNTRSLFQLKDGNIIIVFSFGQKICIINTKNIFKIMEQLYSFTSINIMNIDRDMQEFIFKIIEIKNKNLVKLSKNSISFYLNLYQPGDNNQLYNYQIYNEIKQKKGINNFSILEFNDNFVIVCSGKFPFAQNGINYISKQCYLTLINIEQNKKEKDNSYKIEYTFHKVNGLIVYFSIYIDNNILIKLTDDILGIGGKNIYLYSLKYKEIFQIVEIPTIQINYYFSVVSSFIIENNQIIYIAVKYFIQKEKLDNFIIKFYIYGIKENNELNNDYNLMFLSEAKPFSQQSFMEAKEIQY